MSQSKPGPSKGAVFLRRLTSFVVLWAVVLGSLFSGNKLISDSVFLVIMALLTWAGLVEFYGIVRKLGLSCYSKWGIFAGLLLICATFLFFTQRLGKDSTPGRVNDFETSFLIFFVLGLCVRQFVSKQTTAGVVAISTTLFGLMYVPWLLNFIQKINFFPGVEGHYYVLYFILVTKFSDMGAYARRLADRQTQDDPAHQPRQNMGRFRRRDCGFDRREPGVCAFFWRRICMA